MGKLSLLPNTILLQVEIEINQCTFVLCTYMHVAFQCFDTQDKLN